ncbi:gas vesicle protein, partial [Bifidobacterium bifidum]
MAERGIHAAAPFPRLRQDHVRVILAEPIVQTGAGHIAGAGVIAGLGRR